MKTTIHSLFILLFFTTNCFAQTTSVPAVSEPNIVDEDGYIVFATGDTVKGLVTIIFKEKDEPGTTTLKSMDMGREVTVKELVPGKVARTKQKVACFFARETRYEPIQVKDGSALAFMSKVSTGNMDNVHFFKSYYQAGNFSIYQDPLDPANFAIKKAGDEKALYISDIFKNKKVAKAFIQSCDVLKQKLDAKDGVESFKDVKLFADFMNTNCK